MQSHPSLNEEPNRFCGANYANRLWRRTILLHIYRLTTLAPPRLLTPQSKKSKWFKCLKAFYNLALKHAPGTTDLPSDYNQTTVPSCKAERLTNGSLIREASLSPQHLTLREENGVSVRTGRTIMEMVRATILERGMHDILSPEVVLAITHVKKPTPTTSTRRINQPSRNVRSNHSQPPTSLRVGVNSLRIPPPRRTHTEISLKAQIHSAELFP